MMDIYWKIEGSGFYALEDSADGYLYVGHEEHSRLIEATLSGAQIALSGDKNALVLVEPDADAD